MPALRSLLAAFLAISFAAHAATRVQSAPVPAEMLSKAFTVRVNGQRVGVAHAAASYDFVSFDGFGPFNIEITAAEAGFWQRGVDIQPWRLGLRPVRPEGPNKSQTIRFRLNGPAKLSISRPREFPEPRGDALPLCRDAAAAGPTQASDSRLRAGRLPPKPQPQKRRDLLLGARLLFLRQPESLEGARRQDSGPGNHRL